MVGLSFTIAFTSADLTQLNFVLWGYVKNIFNQVKINDLQHLKARIRHAVEKKTLAFY
jgi:hypothetical protein